MQKLILSSFILLFSCAVLSSCSKHEDTNPAAPAFSSAPAMDGLVGDAVWTASSLDASVNATGNTHELVINGWEQSSKQTIYMTIRPYNFAPGTFYIGPNQPSTAWYQLGDNAPDVPQQYAKSGKIIIYQVDADTVRGTYDFTIASGTRLTGKFSVVPFK
ncbi:MAG: hypothetical protein JSS82_12215 [Bacteroidetes bacterium]|nr:hypothetical protein [Bacteroidota bacterium]